MPNNFPSADLARRMGAGAEHLISELKIPHDAALSPVRAYLDFLFDRFKQLFIEKHRALFGKDDETLMLRNTEAFGRYMRLNIYRALSLDYANNAPSVNELSIIFGHEDRLAYESPYPRAWRINVQALSALAAKRYKDEVPLVSAHTTLGNLTIARLWFAQNKPTPGETTWELYKRYDSDGSRKMNQGQFYSLLPKEWRQLEQYQVMQGRYEDCVAVEQWFKDNSPIKGETTWELYKRYDADGSRKMNQAQFYSLLPKEWRELEQYQVMNGRYEDCVAVEQWLINNSPIQDETTWELYKRYDSDGSRKMNQGHFYSLLPKTWLQQGNYILIQPPHSECLALENWCKTQDLPTNDTPVTEIMNLYEPLGALGWEPLQFYQVLPQAWRERVRA